MDVRARRLDIRWFDAGTFACHWKYRCWKWETREWNGIGINDQTADIWTNTKWNLKKRKCSKILFRVEKYHDTGYAFFHLWISHIHQSINIYSLRYNRFRAKINFAKHICYGIFHTSFCYFCYIFFCRNYFMSQDSLYRKAIITILTL